MRNKEWKEDFSTRLRTFAVRIIKLANDFPKTPAGFTIASQLIRAATSIGANFVEAQNASSRKDFTQKLSISLREATETVYWLEVIYDSRMLDSKTVSEELSEAKQISAILVVSVKKSKNSLH